MSIRQRYDSKTRPVIELLERLHICGERLFDALIGNELDDALRLLDERDALVSRLAAIRVKPDDEALRPMAASLKAQNDRIADALDLRRQALETAVENTYHRRNGQPANSMRPDKRIVQHSGFKA